MNYLNFVSLTQTSSSIPVIGPIWNTIVDILGKLMYLIYSALASIGFPSIGLAILIFTIITKVILYPITLKQQKSQRMMSVMQPEIKAIQEKYKNKDDQASMMAQQREIKEVYEKYGTSMTGGCLPMLLQMPIIFALYRIIMNIPAYVKPVKDIYENVLTAIGGSAAAPKIIELASNSDDKGLMKIINSLHMLGTEGGYDATAQGNFIIDFIYKLNPSQWEWLKTSFKGSANVITTAQMEADKINSFLGMNLSISPKDGGIASIYIAIPILAGLTQYFASKLMQKSSPSAGGQDQSAQMMKSMGIMMPLMSVFFCFSFPSGIGLYWVASSIMMIIQQYFMNKHFDNISDEDILKESMKKANAKRAKKGLPPLDEKKIEQKVTKMNEKISNEEEKRNKLMEKQEDLIKESTEYYNHVENPSSIRSRANMVKLYNEKKEMKKKK